MDGDRLISLSRRTAMMATGTALGGSFALSAVSTMTGSAASEVRDGDATG